MTTLSFSSAVQDFGLLGRPLHFLQVFPHGQSLRAWRARLESWLGDADLALSANAPVARGPGQCWMIPSLEASRVCRHAGISPAPESNRSSRFAPPMGASRPPVGQCALPLLRRVRGPVLRIPGGTYPDTGERIVAPGPPHACTVPRHVPRGKFQSVLSRCRACPTTVALKLRNLELSVFCC